MIDWSIRSIGLFPLHFSLAYWFCPTFCSCRWFLLTHVHWFGLVTFGSTGFCGLPAGIPCFSMLLLQESIKEADTDNGGSVSFGELVALMHKLKKDPNAASSSAFVNKIHKAPAQVRECAGPVSAGCCLFLSGGGVHFMICSALFCFGFVVLHLAGEGVSCCRVRSLRCV